MCSNQRRASPFPHVSLPIGNQTVYSIPFQSNLAYPWNRLRHQVHTAMYIFGNNPICHIHCYGYPLFQIRITLSQKRVCQDTIETSIAGYFAPLNLNWLLYSYFRIYPALFSVHDRPWIVILVYNCIQSKNQPSQTIPVQWNIVDKTPLCAYPRKTHTSQSLHTPTANRLKELPPFSDRICLSNSARKYLFNVP